MARREITPGYARLEWGLGILSGAVVLAIIGYLAYQGIVNGGKEPDSADRTGAGPGRG